MMAEDDVLAIVGGVNCVTEDSLAKIGGEIDELALTMGGKRVVWVEAPIRHDKLGRSQNKLILKQNSIIKEKCIINKWTYLSLNCILDRHSHYTGHGLHLSRQGKDMMCDIIVNYISCSMTSKNPVSTQKNSYQNMEKLVT